MKIYFCCIDDFDDLCGIELLWPDRQDKVARYLMPADRARCLVGGLLMSRILSISDASQLKFNSYGKPSLSNCFFNLSHSGMYVIMAVSDAEIGVDIEQILPYSDDVAKKCFVLEEYRWLKQQGDLASFYALWTAKESIMKASGLGLQMAPESFDVLPVADGPRTVRGKTWFLYRHIHDGHQICIASEKEIYHIEMIHLSKSDLLNWSEEMA